MKAISVLKDYFWKFPDGLFWKMTEKATMKSRESKYKLFVELIKPKPEDKILDVGVAQYIFRGTNYLEQWYPHKKNITAISNMPLDGFGEFVKEFPEVKLEFGDARNLKYKDKEFDIVFSNAVIEHVGSNEKQKQFVHELVRVSKKVFITTPNYWFPVDFHTLIPFAHWFPLKVRAFVYKLLKKDLYATEENLNLISCKRFISLFPNDVKVKIIKQKFLGLNSNLIAVVE